MPTTEVHPVDPTVTTNDEQRLFVVRNGRGFSCLGYDECFDVTDKLAKALGRDDLRPSPEDKGTLGQYEARGRLMALFAASPVSKATWFDPNTPEGVGKALLDAMRDGTRIRVTYGDALTGRAWEERANVGTVSRTMGTMKVPILVSNARSTGGIPVMTAHVVQILDQRTKAALYRHPTFDPIPVSKVPEPETEASAAPSM